MSSGSPTLLIRDGIDQRLDHFFWKSRYHVGLCNAGERPALTRILLGPSSLARDQVIPLTADLLYRVSHA